MTYSSTYSTNILRSTVISLMVVYLVIPVLHWRSTHTLDCVRLSQAFITHLDSCNCVVSLLLLLQGSQIQQLKTSWIFIYFITSIFRIYVWNSEKLLISRIIRYLKITKPVSQEVLDWLAFHLMYSDKWLFSYVLLHCFSLLGHVLHVSYWF